MGGHIVGALGGVAEERVAVRGEPGKDALEILAHRGIGVFTHDERGARVMDEDVAQAAIDLGLADRALISTVPRPGVATVITRP